MTSILSSYLYMRGLDPKIYSKDYYLNFNLGFEEFRKFKGKKVHERIINFSSLIKVKKDIQILDVGCGRGDLSFELSRKGAKVTGIDYSSEGINLAKSSLKKQNMKIQSRVSFFVMNAKKLKLKDNAFDVIVSFDVFEHLYKEELEVVMSEISRVLKPGGDLLIHTEVNKIYLEFTHKVWSYPIDQLLVKINKLIFHKQYSGLSKDPRNDFHKKQHVNEPTYFYLKGLFKRHKFKGKIISIVPLKPVMSWKDSLHNIFVSLSPVSQFFPFHLFFAHDFICVMKNNKEDPRSK